MFSVTNQDETNEEQGDQEDGENASDVGADAGSDTVSVVASSSASTEGFEIHTQPPENDSVIRMISASLSSLPLTTPSSAISPRAFSGSMVTIPSKSTHTTKNSPKSSPATAATLTVTASAPASSSFERANPSSPREVREALTEEEVKAIWKAYPGQHVFVLVHGYQGNSWDMRLFKNRLALMFPKALFLLSSANETSTEVILELGLMTDD